MQAKRIENMEKRLADLDDKYSNSSKEVTVLKAEVRKLEEEMGMQHFCMQSDAPRKLP